MRAMCAVHNSTQIHARTENRAGILYDELFVLVIIRDLQVSHRQLGNEEQL